MKVLMIVAMGALALAFVACETGNARVVSNCAQCTAVEQCVTQGSTLYCADSCLSDSQCLGSVHPQCGQMEDASIPAKWHWVCLPDQVYTYYQGKKIYHRMGGDCSTDANYLCASGEYCLGDTTDSTVFFCAESCNYNSDCAMGCCATTTSNGGRCAPTYYCP